jgi:hypothetical protein
MRQHFLDFFLGDIMFSNVMHVATRIIVQVPEDLRESHHPFAVAIDYSNSNMPAATASPRPVVW